MTATTTAPALPEVPSTTPAWLPKLVALLLLIAGPVLAYLDPDGKIKSGLVQAIIILVFVVVAAVIFTVHLILENGLTKTGITKTITEEEAWVRAHAAELQSTFNAAKPALDAIPGVPAALAVMRADVTALKKAAPAPTREAIEAVVKDVVPGLVIPQVLAIPPAGSVPVSTSAPETGTAGSVAATTQAEALPLAPGVPPLGPPSNDVPPLAEPAPAADVTGQVA